MGVKEELTVGFPKALSSGVVADLHRKSRNRSHQQAAAYPNQPSQATPRASLQVPAAPKATTRWEHRATFLFLPRPASPLPSFLIPSPTPFPACFSSSFISLPTKTDPGASICFMSKEASGS